MVRVELVTGTTAQYVLVALDTKTEWAVGVTNDGDGGTRTTLVRKGNITTITPAQTHLVGGIRYLWAAERHRTLDPETYSGAADRLLSILRDQ